MTKSYDHRFAFCRHNDSFTICSLREAIVCHSTISGMSKNMSLAKTNAPGEAPSAVATRIFGC